MITKVDIPLPPKPDDELSEPEFASLIFTDTCTVSAVLAARADAMPWVAAVVG
jgi:hypothetical protein